MCLCVYICLVYVHMCMCAGDMYLCYSPMCLDGDLISLCYDGRHYDLSKSTDWEHKNELIVGAADPLCKQMPAIR